MVHMQKWYLYIVRCCHGSLYTGIATDVERRFAEHQANKGAKYLR
ncbi:GIY-YIG nuclease family protein, partial [Thermodesulfobacteriota bacterium]